jgi:hypothetical protein
MEKYKGRNKEETQIKEQQQHLAMIEENDESKEAQK